MKKHIQIRIAPKYKDIFLKNRNKIPQLIDKIISENIPIQRIDDFDIYSERITITIDELHFEKLLELQKKYKMKTGTLIRNIVLNLISEQENEVT